MIKITIPCHTYIRKFVQGHYPQGSDVLKLSRHSFIGSVIFTMLEKNAYTYEPGEYRDQLTFEIGEMYFDRYGAGITPAQVHQFNRIMDDLFREGMFRAVDMATNITCEYRKTTYEVKSPKHQKMHRRRFFLIQKPPEIMQCIQFYCRIFAIDENDIMMETLKKSYYRHRKSYNRSSRVFS